MNDTTKQREGRHHQAGIRSGRDSAVLDLAFAGTLESPADALQFISADAYMTGPRSSRHATAFGAAISPNHIMPYVQFGSRTPQDKSWYTTQAFLFIPDSDLFLWLPSITTIVGDPRPRATHLTFGGGVGTRKGEPLYLISVGFVMEFFRANARVR